MSEFLEYIKNAREEFTRDFLSDYPTTKERVNVENILIAYDQMFDRMKWVKTSERLPDENVGVLCFIPEEDDHITTGMWDVSKKWVLLDEYRVPKSQVTHWMYMPVEIPEDKSFEKTFIETDELNETSHHIRDLQKGNYELGKELATLKKIYNDLAESHAKQVIELENKAEYWENEWKIKDEICSASFNEAQLHYSEYAEKIKRLESELLKAKELITKCAIFMHDPIIDEAIVEFLNKK